MLKNIDIELMRQNDNHYREKDILIKDKCLSSLKTDSTMNEETDIWAIITIMDF